VERKNPPNNRRARRRRFITDDPIDVNRKQDAGWRLKTDRGQEVRSRFFSEASRRAVWILRELASRYRAADLLEVAGFLEERIAVYVRILGPSPGAVELPAEVGDVDQLRREMAKREFERDRLLLAERLPNPDRRQELRRAEDIGSGVDLAIAGARRRIDFVLIHAMGDIESESRALRRAHWWRLADFLAAESFAMGEVFAGRRPPASLEGRLRARARAESEAEEKGYKD
jgi:hypothetical protein